MGKTRLGDLTLDDVTNYLAFRLRGNVVRSFDFARERPGPGGMESISEDKTDLAFPEVFSLFAAGTVAHNVGFYVELENNVEEGATDVERGFVSLNNLGGHNWAHLRAGRLDPSAFWSYPTLRQQVGLVNDDTVDKGPFAIPTVKRMALAPAAFAAKFSGLFDRGGKAILPFQLSLFNAVSEIGVDIHGRPFGEGFLYQLGVLNGANEKFGDSNNPKDWYVMIRLDHAESDFFSASLSGFSYFGNNNAKVASGADVSWNRYGVAGNVRYKMIDVYGAFVIDRVTDLPQSLVAVFDETATGLTLEVDVLPVDRILLSIRYDHADAGGLLSQRASYSFLGLQAKYYLRSNIALFVRDDVNLQKAEGGRTAVRNFRNGAFVGADLVF